MRLCRPRGAPVWAMRARYGLASCKRCCDPDVSLVELLLPCHGVCTDEWRFVLIMLKGSSLSRNWDLGRQIGDEHGVLIECRDVHKSFGDKHVLQGVSFKVSPRRSLYIFPLLADCFGSVPVGHYFEPTICSWVLLDGLFKSTL